MSAIDEMAKRAVSDCETSEAGTEANRQRDEAIIAHHYQEGVRELVLAAREVSSELLKADAFPADIYPEVERLRKALEGFQDVE